MLSFPQRSSPREIVNSGTISAWSTTHTFLSVAERLENLRSDLIAINDKVVPLRGFVARELALINDELWVHDAYDGFTRLCKDGTRELYRDREVTRVGTFLGGREALPPAKFAVNNGWKMARDGAGHLWLITWDAAGGGVTLRARWDGAAFRPPSALEAAAARGGLLESAGRLWFAADLPNGFQRDAWRAPAGLPKLKDSAVYAVDQRGTPWVVCGAVAARWDGARWQSVANRLPGPAVPFTNIIADQHGVFITLPGMVAHLE